MASQTFEGSECAPQARCSIRPRPANPPYAVAHRGPVCLDVTAPVSNGEQQNDPAEYDGDDLFNRKNHRNVPHSQQQEAVSDLVVTSRGTVNKNSERAEPEMPAANTMAHHGGWNDIYRDLPGAAAQGPLGIDEI